MTRPAVSSINLVKYLSRPRLFGLLLQTLSCSMFSFFFFHERRWFLLDTGVIWWNSINRYMCTVVNILRSRSYLESSHTYMPRAQFLGFVFCSADEQQQQQQSAVAIGEEASSRLAQKRPGADQSVRIDFNCNRK